MSLKTLYRKYRPQIFAEVTGQNAIKITLQNELSTGKIVQAYLFNGPRGVGKTTLARIFAKAVNCERRADGQAEPCNQCSSCLEITAGNSLDLVEIDAASHTGVDSVRENIINTVRFTPVKSKFKVFIIDEVHMLSISAFNALLKTLEEPPAHVIFILATTEAHKLPATIISRCQRFDFRKINRDEMFSALNEIVRQEGFTVEKEVFDSIILASDGCLRDALSILGQILSLGEKQITSADAELIIPRSTIKNILEFLTSIANSDVSQGLVVLNDLGEDGVDWQHFIDETMEVTRLLLLANLRHDTKSLDFYFTNEQRISVDNILPKLNSGLLVAIINNLVIKKQWLKTSHIPQLPLEVALVELVERGQNSVVMTGKSAEVVSAPAETVKKKLEAKVESIKKTVEKMIHSENKPAFENNVVGASTNAVLPTIDEIKNKWSEVLRVLADEQPSLFLALKIGQPLEIKDNKLIIGFAFGLYRDKVNEFRNKSTVAAILQKVFACNLSVEGIISEQAKINLEPEVPQEVTRADNSQVQEALADFGVAN